MLILIDNYDSFTYNLVHYFQEIGEKVKVFRNDEISSEEILKLNPTYLVISPGPSTPLNSGICMDLIKLNSSRKKPIPTLGVCLGHQVIAECFDAKVIQSGKPVHGKVSKIFYVDSKLFEGMDNPFNATRYHSLIVDEKTIKSNLIITAKTEHNVIMAIEHKRLPFFGVQFHPESIATEYGHLLLKNFLRISK
tara:strand:+ start:133 stop:711 length:579 start_codon:yes stop_codon:yes gene_type:complete